MTAAFNTLLLFILSLPPGFQALIYFCYWMLVGWMLAYALFGD